MVQRKAPDANTVASCMAMASFHQMKHAAMAETLPNYMKPTTSSDAKKQHACVSSSEDLKKKKKKKNCKALRIQPKKVSVRATCSSTLKSCKFPEFLELGHGGTEAEGASAVKVCPYKYCSLNGHLHGQADIPPLKTFLASRRESMKQRGASPFRKRDTGQAAAARTRSGLEISSLIEEIGLDLFLEQPAAVEEEDDRNDACSDRSSDGVYSLEAMAGFVEYVSCDRDVEEDRSKKEIEDGNQFMAESIDFNLEKEEEDDDDYEEEAELESKKMDKSENNTPKEHAVLDQEQPATEEEARNEDVQITDTNDQDHNNGSVLIVADSNSNIIEEQTAPTDDHGPNVRLMHITRKSSRDEESEQLKGFDPRAPNFLPEEPDPESEKVDLRHQMMDERKNAEEWMIDYALQQTVTKLGSARRKKVALLVEAFETVNPLPPLQACR
ncbi:calmodulin binding protein PICBP-like [Zingiber officinale]|uniref:Calmodulin-binding domain-containing protein n=1 Tax=Zingiber officinale TaxID=94328 RepID=A0A8J5L8J6_ZINOF|nr:calmodulin binding protein PICBP-like [Zingiber officinale]KAG6504011.1 hypothetical protein ZIOFF_036335 [Zingiber officinale]